RDGGAARPARRGRGQADRVLRGCAPFTRAHEGVAGRGPLHLRGDVLRARGPLAHLLSPAHRAPGRVRCKTDRAHAYGRGDSGAPFGGRARDRRGWEDDRGLGAGRGPAKRRAPARRYFAASTYSLVQVFVRSVVIPASIVPCLIAAMKVSPAPTAIGVN